MVFTWKNNVAFTLISFPVLKWDDCLSVQLPFELPVQIPVQLFLELELNWLHSSKCDWTRMYVDETSLSFAQLSLASARIMIFCCSTECWVTGSDTGSVASRARTVLTSSKCDWTRIWAIQNVDETTLGFAQLSLANARSMIFCCSTECGVHSSTILISVRDWISVRSVPYTHI